LIVMRLLKINYVLLAPWIILSLPPSALSQQSILVVVIVTIVGLLGMVLGNKTAIELVTADSLGKNCQRHKQAPSAG
jgi:hypothetical protein